MKVLRLLALFALSALSAAAVPVVNAVQNNYSFIQPGLPSYGIGQGSIFVLYGSGLADTSTGLQSVPLGTTLEGVSAAVVVRGVTTHVILYYVTPTQIAGILPSATPVGTGEITVTNNGQTSAPAPIRVERTAFGVLSLNGTGSGAAAVFDAQNNFLGPNNAANPGDVLVFYGTGLGPVTGDETVQQVQTNLTDIHIDFEIGNRPAEILYRGRSIFPGLDQINVRVPQDAPFGCAVAVAVFAAGIVSNYTTIPVAESGSTCVDQRDPSEDDLSQSEIEQWITAGTFRQGGVALGRTTSHTVVDTLGGGVNRGTMRTDNVAATFYRFTGDLGAMFRGNQAPPVLGQCVVNSTQIPNLPPFSFSLLNAGDALSVSGAAGGIQLERREDLAYYTDLGAVTLPDGSYTVTGPGGPDVGPFSISYTLPQLFSWDNPAEFEETDRAEPITVTWSGGRPDQWVFIQGQSVVVNGTQALIGSFTCHALSSWQTFTIPASVLSAVPPTQAIDIGGTPFWQRGSLSLSTTGAVVRGQAGGLDYLYFSYADTTTQQVLWR